MYESNITNNSRNSSNANEANGAENATLLKAPPSPERQFKEPARDIPVTEETTCGIWCLKGPCLQIFANKKAYVFLYGILGCIFSASYAYFNGTITTIEKRFKIPSKTTGECQGILQGTFFDIFSIVEGLFAKLRFISEARNIFFNASLLCFKWFSGEIQESIFVIYLKLGFTFLIFLWFDARMLCIVLQV